MHIPDKDTTYLFEGVYAISLKQAPDDSAFFYDWYFLKRPYINKVYYFRNRGYYVLAAFSGTPPMGQALMLRLDPDVGIHINFVQQTYERGLVESGTPHPLVVL